MQDHKKQRNEQIVQMSRAGVPHADIARQFDLSRTSIDNIVRRPEEERRLAEEFSRILGAIRRVDDLDRRWPVIELIDALRLKGVTRSGLLMHYRKQGTEEISMRDLMDQAILKLDDERPGYLLSPMLNLNMIRKVGFYSLVDQLSHLELGKNCREEWNRRILLLGRSTRLVGSEPHSWSEPARR